MLGRVRLDRGVAWGEVWGSDPAEEELVGARSVKRQMGSRFPVRMGMRPVSVVFYSI